MFTTLALNETFGLLVGLLYTLWHHQQPCLPNIEYSRGGRTKKKVGAQHYHHGGYIGRKKAREREEAKKRKISVHKLTKGGTQWFIVVH